MHRWAVILQAYNYEVRYRRSTEHGNANHALLSTRINGQLMKKEVKILFFAGFDDLPVSTKAIS